MQPINITAYTEDPSQIEAVKAFLKSLKIKFEIAANKPFTLSSEQQKILDNQLNSDKSQYSNAATLYSDLKKKYEL
ncbi:hypothetical protein E0F76_04910 [Flavobacterium cellulosilyticum]|uniref:Uncharacterized protein n=1 Tax=Flavobacterium cellulosilyticum TaxID=2541731 RepID=A0A4R5CMN3_9FLAO|nr:hypothetical protein E0F76_04910 [Flavobacterium cellulosilyticum]